MIQPNHRPPASKQHNFNRIKAERPESNRRPERDSVSFPLAYIPHNPDSRVSKVFNVLCLNTRRFGLRQHRLYGRAPLHGLNSTVQLYARKEGMPSCTNGNGTCRKLRPLFNLQIPPEPVSVKDTHPRKEEPMKKMSMSSGGNHL